MIDVVVFFFLLGVFARLVKSDLRLPEALYETLSIYLLLAIGLKGGIELSKQPLAALAPQVLACMALGFVIPFALFPLARALRLSGVDAAALVAHYGSVSVVTFAVATAALTRQGIAYESHAALWVAVMEAPGLVAGILLARWSLRDAERGRRTDWGGLAHDVLFLTRGAPAVYYGDEAGMTGSVDGKDRNARQDMFPTQVPAWQSEQSPLPGWAASATLLLPEAAKGRV